MIPVELVLLPASFNLGRQTGGEVVHECIKLVENIYDALLFFEGRDGDLGLFYFAYSYMRYAGTSAVGINLVLARLQEVVKETRGNNVSMGLEAKSVS